MPPNKDSWLNKRLGPRGIIGVVVFAVGLAFVLSQFVPRKDRTAEVTPTPTPTVVACTKLAKPYGDAPDGFTYEKVDEATRLKTIKALQLDEAGGKVDMRKATRGGISLGSIVGVPSADPADYAASLVASAQQSGAKVTRGSNYAIVPLSSGENVAVGVKGCQTVLISSQDPNGTRYLAAVIFG